MLLRSHVLVLLWYHITSALVLPDHDQGKFVPNFISKYSDNGDFFKHFQGYAAIESFLAETEAFCERQSAVASCSVESIGESTENREIFMVKISNGQPNNRAIWVDGGMHAREWLSQPSAAHLIEYLLINAKNESHPTYGIDWYVTPVLNPDGYVQTWRSPKTRLHRKTMRDPDSCPLMGSNGVDLNRNFDFHWNQIAGASSSNPCKDGYAGPKAFSEPESRAVRDVLQDDGIEWKAYVSLHTFGRSIYYPYAYMKRLPKNHKQLDAVAKAMAQAIQKATGSVYQYGSSAFLTYPTTGSSDDWAFHTLNLPFSFTIELGPDDQRLGIQGFVSPESDILLSAKEVSAAMGVLAQAVKGL